MEAIEFISKFLPKGTLEFFDLKDFRIKEGPEKYMGLYGFDDEYTIVLEEKAELPEFPDEASGKALRTKGYSTEIIEDFPIRGRKTRLELRRRKWQIAGESKIYQREIEVTKEGTRYSGEFAFFFEEGD